MGYLQLDLLYVAQAAEDRRHIGIGLSRLLAHVPGTEERK